MSNNLVALNHPRPGVVVGGCGAEMCSVFLSHRACKIDVARPTNVAAPSDVYYIYITYRRTKCDGNH